MAGRKTPRYESFGDELSTEVSYWQAANTLDVAAHIAERVGDIKSLLDTSAMWIALGDKLRVGDDASDEADEEEEELQDFGFRREITSGRIDATGGDEEDAPSEVELGLHQKHG